MAMVPIVGDADTWAWQDGGMSEATKWYSRPEWIGGGLLLAACLLAAAIALGVGEPFAIDALWQEFISEVRGPVLLAVSYAMDFLGGGWFGIFVVPIGVAVMLLVMRRPWGAAYFIAASIVSTAIAQLMKQLVGRDRPEDMIVVSDFGSFPSGHAANAATVAVALFVLFPRVWVAIAGAAWVVLMAFSRTYLGAHWVSDTIGGALIGAAAALLTAAVFGDVLIRERSRQRSSANRESTDEGPSLG
jgi:undecaprenyl-diphosphatase